MVVDQNERRRRKLQRPPYDLAGIDGRVVDGPVCDQLVAHQDVAPVEEEGAELFPGQMGQGDPSIVEKCVPGAQHRPGADGAACQTHTQLAEKFEVHDRCRPDAVHASKLGTVSGGDAAQVPKLPQQVGGHPSCDRSGNASTEQQTQQIVV